jgi:hypothetical protein
MLYFRNVSRFAQCHTALDCHFYVTGIPDSTQPVSLARVVSQGALKDDSRRDPENFSDI